MRMVTFNFGPFVNMMHIHLGGLRPWLLADNTFVSVASLDKFANSFPAFATVAVSPPFPVRRLVTSRAISRVIGSGSLSQSFHRLWSNLTRWVQFRMVSAVLAIARIAAKFSGCVRAFAFVDCVLKGPFPFNLAKYLA